jgi:hypothetical protein
MLAENKQQNLGIPSIGKRLAVDTDDENVRKQTRPGPGTSKNLQRVGNSKFLSSNRIHAIPVDPHPSNSIGIEHAICRIPPMSEC